ncbi:hypothetical protein TWF281_003236 [Arthrobotrys megalospora]
MFLYTTNRVFLTTQYKYGSEEPPYTRPKPFDDGLVPLTQTTYSSSAKLQSAIGSRSINKAQGDVVNDDTQASESIDILTDAELVHMEVKEIPSREKGKQRADLSPNSSFYDLETRSDEFEKIDYSENEYTDGLTSYYNNGVLTCSASLATNPTSEQYDLIDFLAIAQHRGVDMVPFRWDDGSDIGMGGTAKISEGVTAETSLGHKLCLAFKRFQREGSRYEADRNKIFQALLSEVYILGHPVVQQHPNINSLKGIAWDTVYDEVWPVLVFKKTEYGDLKHFIGTDEGKKMEFRQKVRLCYEIGNAVNLIHACRKQKTSLMVENKAADSWLDAIHGDLKPQNILIFKNYNDEFSAKVTDFGFSTIFAKDEDIRITLPHSWPWTAPEIEKNPPVSFEQAKAADLFSYGLLCYWLLFYDELKHIASSEFSHEPRISELLLIDKIKRKPDLNKLIEGDLRAVLLSTQEGHSHRGLFELEFFLASCLCQDSSLRTMEINTLPDAFDFPGTSLPLIEEYGNFALLRSKATFNLIAMLARFRFCQAETKEAIIRCLKARTGSPDKDTRERAAYDLALCYQQGFGVAADQEKCQFWLEKADRPPEVLEMLVEMLESDTSSFYSFNNTKIVFTDSKKLIRDQEKFNIQPHGYYEHELFSAATSAWIHKELEIEVQEIHVLRHPDLSSIAAKKEVEDNVNALRVKLGWENDSTIGVSTITMPFKPELPDEARRFRRLPRSSYGSVTSPNDDIMLLSSNLAKKAGILGPDHELVIQDVNILFLYFLERGDLWEAEKRALLLIYLERGVYGRENPKTLGTMEKLAGLYIRVMLLEQAESLIFEVLDARIRVLGAKHPDTVRIFVLMEDLIEGYNRGRNIEKVIPILKKLVDLKQQVYGIQDTRTLRAMQCLAVHYILDESIQSLMMAENIIDCLVRETKVLFGEQSIEMADNNQLLAVVYVVLARKEQYFRHRNYQLKGFQLEVDRIRSRAESKGIEQDTDGKLKAKLSCPDPEWGSRGRPGYKGVLDSFREIVWDYLQELLNMTPFDKSIEFTEKEIDDAGDLSVQGAEKIMGLGRCYNARFLFTEQMDDSDISIAWLQIALEMLPTDDLRRPLWVKDLASHHGCRYEILGLFEDLEKKISLLEEAISATLDDENIKDWLSSLAQSLKDRYNITGAVDDLNAALVLSQQMIEISPVEVKPYHDGSGIPNTEIPRGGWIFVVADMWREKFRLSEFKDIEAVNSAISGIECARKMDFRRMRELEMQIRARESLRSLYKHRHDLLNNNEDMDSCIQISEELVDIASKNDLTSFPELKMLGKPYGAFLGRLAGDHFWRYTHLESLRDLEIATEYIQEAAELIFPDSSMRPFIDNLQGDIRIANFRVNAGKPGWKV